jgi:hypothetical protein
MILGCLTGGDFLSYVRGVVDEIYQSASALVKRCEALRESAQQAQIDKTLITTLSGGLTERGYGEYAYGAFVRDICGVELCVDLGGGKPKCDDKLVAESVALGRLGDLRVRVGSLEFWKL